MNLKCADCGYEQPVPMHCHQPMHKEGNQLVCHMGVNCGTQNIPSHCGKSMQFME